VQRTEGAHPIQLIGACARYAVDSGTPSSDINKHVFSYSTAVLCEAEGE